MKISRTNIILMIQLQQYKIQTQRCRKWYHPLRPCPLSYHAKNSKNKLDQSINRPSPLESLANPTHLLLARLSRNLSQWSTSNSWGHSEKQSPIVHLYSYFTYIGILGYISLYYAVLRSASLRWLVKDRENEY